MGWKVAIDSEDCPWMSAYDMCLLYEIDINLDNSCKMDCTEVNCPRLLTGKEEV